MTMYMFFADSCALCTCSLVPEANPEQRRMWMFIGTGKHIELGYFLPLSDPKNTDQTASNTANQFWDMGEEEPERDTNVEEVDMEIGNDNDDQDEIEEAKMQLETVFSKLKEKILVRVPHDPKGYKKSLRSLEKHLDRMPKKDAALQKALCTFGQESFAQYFNQRKQNASLPQ